MVSPPDHKLPVALLEVKVTLSTRQKVVGPLAVIDGVGGNELTVTTTEDDEFTHPLPSVSVTE